MSSTEKAEQLRLGFLTAVEFRDRAYVGGLLVTDSFGRPIEFQCTTPVKPNRTQELLYGPTLVPFILGELLGKTLMEKVSVKPKIVFVDRLEILPLRTCINAPVLCLLDKTRKAQDSQPTVELGKHQFALHMDFESDRDFIKKAATQLGADVDMKEPLDRVGDALKETMATVSGQPRVA